MALIDARTLPDGHRIDADVCIIGGGAAGLTLADELGRSPLRVAILESGGLEPDSSMQALYEGEIVGVADYPLHTSRLRFFGGTTNHWTAFVRPLDALDFEARSWVPDSGWPFAIDELAPGYERVRQLFHLPEYAFDVGAWTSEVRIPWQFEDDRVVSEILQILPERERRFGPRFQSGIEQSANVDAYLFATVTEILVNEAQSQVRHLRIGGLGGKDVTTRARCYVLAAGGIENARILLLSSSVADRGVGNSNDLVGRFFANHPETRRFVDLLPSNTVMGAEFYRPNRHRDGTTGAYLRLSDSVQRELQLLNCRIRVGPEVEASAEHTGVASLIAMTDRFASVQPSRGDAGRSAPLPLRLNAIAEQAPNPESRVRLGEGRDRLGQREVVLDWRLMQHDSDSVRETVNAFARECGLSGLGRVRDLFPAGGLAALDVKGSYHHMGTTRMNDDPKRGVVDADCRVHGLTNLFVAGSSVFPSYGTANPTYTILALVFRLAEHLRGVLR